MLIHGVISLMNNFLKRRLKMQKIQYKCDHCGKEIDDFNDYTDLEIELASFHKCVDLCTDCYNQLAIIVYEFTTCKKE